MKLDCCGRKQNKSILVLSTLAGLESNIVIGLISSTSAFNFNNPVFTGSN